MINVRRIVLSQNLNMYLLTQSHMHNNSGGFVAVWPGVWSRDLQVERVWCQMSLLRPGIFKQHLTQAQASWVIVASRRPGAQHPGKVVRSRKISKSYIQWLKSVAVDDQLQCNHCFGPSQPSFHVFLLAPLTRRSAQRSWWYYWFVRRPLSSVVVRPSTFALNRYSSYSSYSIILNFLLEKLGI